MVAVIAFGSFAMANNVEVETVEVRTESVETANNSGKLKVIFDLGDLSKLSESELDDFFDSIPIQHINSEIFKECTVTYTATFSIMGSSVTVTASGTAEDCDKAGRIARDGIRNEYKQAKKLIKELVRS